MTRKQSIDDIITKLDREATSKGDRFVNLCIDVVDELDPSTTILSVGGRWDRRANRVDTDQLGDFVDDEAIEIDGETISGEADRAVVIRVHAGQLAAIAWFRGWLEAHAVRRDNPTADYEATDGDPSFVYSALFAGGRRGGKSWTATACAVMYAVAFPDAIVWLVSKNDTKHDEFRRYVGGFVASSWVESETEEGWQLCNGSRLLLKSAHTPEGLKEGTCHFAVLNEGQGMKLRAYTVVRGAIVDRAGLVLICANPPVEAGDQQWVTEFAANAAAGKRESVYLNFNPLENPHIDRRALLSMRSELDERTFAIEVLGEFRGPKDAVAYNWLRLYNEGKAPTSGDCTEAFLDSLEEGEGLRCVVGLDVQRFPHIGGPIFRFFGDPDSKRVIAWIVDEVVLEGGDEVDFCNALREKNYDPVDTLIVCDASGRYQHSRRSSMEAPPPQWTGRGSFDIIRGEGFFRIVPPDRRLKTNPHIIDRMRAFTSMISTDDGSRRLFADPEAAPETCKAIREWRTLRGTPHRQQREAHLGDAASYPIVRLFPRRLKDGNTGAVDPIAAKIDAVSNHGSESLRITPLSGGSTNARNRRGDRFRGM